MAEPAGSGAATTAGNRYIGLISGTSMDGVDAALASFTPSGLQVHHALTLPYTASLRTALERLTMPDARIDLHDFASLNIRVGQHFARAARDVVDAACLAPADITAIGSHGQTLRHSPHTVPPYTLQIGDPATITTHCGVTTIADFRSLDVAAGGEGAPLVPPFHDAYLRDPNADTVVVNIGGIANITVLPRDPALALQGFDTGPGNCMLDAWSMRINGKPFDDRGAWGASGTVHEPLLAALMDHEYIHRNPPKSTGREYYDLADLERLCARTASATLPPADVQATLQAFTVASIAHGIEQSGVKPAQVFVCGGGARNDALMARLAQVLAPANVASTQAAGIDPDYVEALAFAWLARQRLAQTPVKLTTEGISRSRVLGAVYVPSK